MAQRIIGLDVGSWSIKAAVLESSLRRAQLVAYHEHHIPSGPAGASLEGAQEAAITATLRALEPDALIAAVPGSSLLTREIQLPFSDEKRVAQVLGFELETVIPRPIEEVVYDYQIVREDEDGTTLLCPAVDRGRLESWLATLREAGADPRFLTATGISAEELVGHVEVEGAEVVALVDLGHRTTTVSVVSNGRVEAMRTISRGGHQLTLALSRGMEVDYAQAEHIKHTGVRFDGYLPEGIEEADHGARARLVARALEPLLREVRMTLHARAERGGAPVTRVIAYAANRARTHRARSTAGLSISRTEQ